MAPLLPPSASDRPFDCGDIERFSYAYLDGEFAPSERDLIERHLAGCRECGRKIQEAAAFRALLRLHARAAAPAPSALRARITQSLDHEEREQRRRTAWSTARQAAPAIAAGLAAAAGLAFLFVHVAPFSSAQWVADDAVNMHARSLPLEVSTGDLSHLLPLFERHLGFAVRPPAFPERRIALIGGRLSHLGPRDAAYLEYGAGPGHRVSLFIMADPDRDLHVFGSNPSRPAERPLFLTNVRGYSVAVWRRNEIVYSMVSDLNGAEMRQLVAAGEAR
ncbi:MAG: anti-sigma factor family protein [Myxococcales bacterium]